jgi:hypothetical protein
MRARLNVTHTYAILELSREAFDEIAAKLRAAGYDQAFHGDVIYMHGIAVGPPQSASVPMNPKASG